MPRRIEPPPWKRVALEVSLWAGAAALLAGLLGAFIFVFAVLGSPAPAERHAVEVQAEVTPSADQATGRAK